MFETTTQKPIINKAIATESTISSTKFPLFKFRKEPMAGTLGIKKK